MDFLIILRRNDVIIVCLLNSFKKWTAIVFRWCVVRNKSFRLLSIFLNEKNHFSIR